MRTAELIVRYPTEDPHRDFQRVSDFQLFPMLAEDVRAVRVHPAPAPDLPRDTEWEVSFRRGVLRWTEWETVDPDRLRIEFDQAAGDFTEFRGHWQLTPVRGGCEVRFEVSYDFGIDSLAGIMDPIAERVIKRVICSVLSGLFGEITVLRGGEALTDLALRTA
ncbi:MAG TPA: SRPBCC family protein [Actinophytocola sp.]|jgi:ribosome-associated toxin RatA of RatAB toxin-antitoxin module|uniref:type II toxin-antitoxin system RatA family toxin n=1 Tax=Actinophytocola sp. TaxID=1872138 RepID=UPI002DF8EE03|nr:SRPBCC family protein [Actinophytocola sp.]